MSMKKCICLFLVLLLVACCAACGSFGKVDLQDDIAIPQDGVIGENILAQMQKENAIGTFTGQSNGLDYEWTVFGSDLSEPADTNFLVNAEKTGEGIKLSLSAEQPFGFSALLSVKMDELWQAQTATAYDGDKAVASVSLTGTKQTVLNLSLDGSVQELTICADDLPADAMKTEETTVVSQQVSSSGDKSYVSGVTASDDKTYTQVSSGQEKTEEKTEEKGAEKTESKKEENKQTDNSYTSSSSGSSDRVYSDGTQSGKDQYQTDPIPAGKPMPVEPENQTVNTSKTYTCTFSIECSTILNNLDQLDPDKLEMVPSGGTILARTTVTFSEGESVYDVLQRLCQSKGIHMESSWTPIYNSAYVEGIHNLYEFDCGSLSGWMYRVNGWYPNYGCSRYQLADGDVVEWRYTCDLGHDVGGAYAVGGQSE